MNVVVVQRVDSRENTASVVSGEQYTPHVNPDADLCDAIGRGGVLAWWNYNAAFSDAFHRIHVIFYEIENIVTFVLFT